MAATIWCTPVPLYPWQALVLRGLNLDLSRSRPYFGYSSSLLQHCQHSPAEMKSSQACESSTHLHHRALSCKPLRQNSIQFNSIQFNPAQFVQLSSASHLSGSHQCARHHWGLNVCRMVYRCVQMRIVKQIILRRGIPLCSAEVLNRRCHGLFCRLCVRQTSEVFVRLRGEGETKQRFRKRKGIWGASSRLAFWQWTCSANAKQMLVQGSKQATLERLRTLDQKCMRTHQK